MKLTNEEINEIIDRGVPETKSDKLALLAVFMQIVAPKVGLEMEGDIIADLMAWSDEAHTEECDFCRDLNAALGKE